MNFWLHFIFDFIVYILAVYLLFYLPGKLLLSLLKLKLDALTNLFLYTMIGFLLFTFLAYLLSWLHIAIIVLPIVFILDIFVIKKNGWFEKITLPKKEKVAILLVLILSFLFSLSVLAIGIYGNTIAYRNDDIVHLAYIHEMQVHFPPQHPGFAGLSLLGYHFFFDFLISQFANITLISPDSLYFHLFPLFVSFAWGIGIYVLLKAWTKKISAGLWGVLLTLFGGSFGFIIRMQGHPKASLDDTFGINQPASALLNPPFASSVVVIITGLIIMYYYLQSKNKKWLILLVLCAGLITMFKVYAGMIFLGGFLFLGIVEIFRRKFSIIPALIITGVLFLGTFGIFVGKGQHLIYWPLWEPHRVLQDNFPWYGYDEKIYTYTRLHVLHGIIETEVYGLVLYFFGNLGTRLIGMLLALFLFIKSRKKPTSFSLVIWIMILISIFIPLFFIQTGKVYEMIQLAWYYPILSSLFAAIGFSYLSTIKIPKAITTIVIVILIIFTLPSAYENFFSHIMQYFQSERESLSSPYFQTMHYLETYHDYNATILEVPSKDSMQNLKGWYTNVSTPHLSAFANKRSYLNYEFLPYTNLDENSRLPLLKKMLWLETTRVNDASLTNAVREELTNNHIVFVYSLFPLQQFQTGNFAKQVYINGGYVIYKIINK